MILSDHFIRASEFWMNLFFMIAFPVQSNVFDSRVSLHGEWSDLSCSETLK